jgi:trimeric autotransporter adhesin
VVLYAYNTSGLTNTAIGWQALCNNTTGYNNIAIGQNSGADAVANITTQNNQIVMGNDAHTDAFIKIAWTVTSDKRDKTNFNNVLHGLNFVNQLKPIQFQFKKSRENPIPIGDIRYGFFAQDILEIEKDNPVIINNTNPNNLKYNESSLIPVLVNAIQDLSKDVEELKQKINS